MPIERKLTAIVFTDIAGFTELSAQDEENAFALIETQRNVLKPIVKGYGGQWLKEIEDGLLLSFPSSIQAVNCALAIQDAVHTIDDLKLRIGIHQGDILQKDDDIFGDDVNIAFQKNNSNAEHFNILWEKEFDEGEQFSLNNNFISFVIKDSNLYKFADVYTGEVVNEYYSLSGNNSFHNKYDNGLFYINSRNKLYSIEPNTKWE